MEDLKIKIRDFKLTAWALNNKNTVYIALFALLIFGFYAYKNMPKELFPEINFPTVFVQTIYSGNSASDIENLITDPLENELNGLDGINELRSTSAQDMSMIFIEYNPDINISDVLPDVKDAVDRAKRDLPDDLTIDPIVIELDFSEFPVVTVNLSGDYNLDELKKYADFLEEELEKINEISKVNISGISEKEVQVNVDLHKAQNLDISFQTIENAIRFENVTMSAGDVILDNTRKSIRIVGEFTTIDQIKNIIIKSDKGKPIYLRDVAEVVETYSDIESISRLDSQPVVSLQIVKKNGENVLSAVQQVIERIELAKVNEEIPANLNITITNDQSKKVNMLLGNLENNLISGVIFVVLILLLFLGLRNSILVGFSIPMSMFLSFAVLGVMGKTVNMITLFSMILALGMLVDNAIVVVENIYRFVDKGFSIKDAARKATSEVAGPIIASTLTTLAAFFPLIFWNDIMGEFMKLLPITLIIVLTSSLINALIFTPVLSIKFIKKAEEIKKPNIKKTLIRVGIMVLISIPLYIVGANTPANILSIVSSLILLYTFVFYDLSKWFQNKFLVWLEDFYSRFITYSLRGKKPQLILGFVTLLLFVTMFFYFGVRQPKVIQFPNNEPTYINVYVELPIDVNINYTDSIMSIIVEDVNNRLSPFSSIIESELVNVGNGVSNDNSFSVGKKFNQGQITINFVDYQYRNGINTSEISQDLSRFLKNRYPGVNIYISKNSMGPPSGKPINIELHGNDFDQLIRYSDSIISIIENANIDGIEKLTLDIETNKPELIISVDKDKAGRFGLTTMQVASTIRTSLFGSEVTKFKTDDDDIPVNVRFDKAYRYNLAALMNQSITFRNQQGQLIKIPISSVATVSINNSFDAIKHVDTKRTITISSNVIEGYNANAINQLIRGELTSLKLPKGYFYEFTGEQEDMKKSMEFLSIAMIIAISLIMLILVTQFNSIIKPLIIIASVGLSTIGVFGGLATFNMDFVVMMTGIGIISLAGVVVNNAIVLIDYIDYLKGQRKIELGMDIEDNLPLSENITCIIEAGKTRLRPVLLTAITTILGLITLAFGLNMNFGTFLSDFDPQIYFGGDSVGFWKPMSLTVIFGLTFATFMTLIVVPIMYLLGNKLKLRMQDKEKLSL
ncbi:MAG: efflux RND transporter permease subunit [Bacteroidales bacterium]|nr:efflux RND transporter permease subunit [Bacteroidales bacterium]